MGTEDWILKDTKLITNIKKQRLKIQRLDSQKYNIKKSKQNKITKVIKNVYEVCFQNRVFFLQGNKQQFIKMKIKGVIEDLKLKKIKNKINFKK